MGQGELCITRPPAHNMVQPVVADQKATDANRDPDSNFFFIADLDLHPNPIGTFRGQINNV